MPLSAFASQAWQDPAGTSSAHWAVAGTAVCWDWPALLWARLPIGRVAEHACAPVVRAGTSLAKSRVSKSIPAARSHVGAVAPSLLDRHVQPALARCEAARRRLDHWSPPPPRPSSSRAGHAPVGYDPSPCGLPFCGWTLEAPWGLHSREWVPQLTVGTFSIGCWLQNTFQEEGRGYFGV